MELKVAFLNCRSHGDAAVVTFTEQGKKKCIVVDGGEDTKSAAALLAYLKSEQVKAIDLMVGTHIDSDHINGLKHFVKGELKKKTAGNAYVDIVEFWGPLPTEELIPDYAPTSKFETGEPGDTISWQEYVIQSVKQNDDLYSAVQEFGSKIRHPALDNKPSNSFQNVVIDFLGPDTQIPADHITKKALGFTTRASEGKTIKTLEDLEMAISQNVEQMAIEAKRNANNQSIVFRLKSAVGGSKAKAWTFLFTGDAEEEAWEEMLGVSKVAKRLPARVLKVPHHGSGQNGITPEGARKVKPKYSIISVGQKHGLPDTSTLALLHDMGSTLLCPQRNDSTSHPSACRHIAAGECPAKNKARDVCFTLDTSSGACTITPDHRACGHAWA